MATKRLFSDDGVYHCVSRTAGKIIVFGNAEKRFFLRKLRAYAHFCGVRVFAHCVMGNHFHILCKVEEEQPLTDSELFDRIRSIYREEELLDFEKQFQTYINQENHGAAEAFRKRFLARMWDVSNFLKELKQCFSIWFNAQHHREGTLWEGRFKSVVLAPTHTALSLCAAYIDLNPVRAGLVEDPKDYPFSSYGAAVGGSQIAQKGLAATMDAAEESWDSIADNYRQMIYTNAYEKRNEASGDLTRKGIPAEDIQRIIDEKGRLSKAQALRCKVRYFTQAGAIGDPHFINDVIKQNADRIPASRKVPSYSVKKADFSGMHTLRNLQRDVFVTSTTKNTTSV